MPESHVLPSPGIANDATPRIRRCKNPRGSNPVRAAAEPRPFPPFPFLLFFFSPFNVRLRATGPLLHSSRLGPPAPCRLSGVRSGLAGGRDHGFRLGTGQTLVGIGDGGARTRLVAQIGFAGFCHGRLQLDFQHGKRSGRGVRLPTIQARDIVLHPAALQVAQQHVVALRVMQHPGAAARGSNRLAVGAAGITWSAAP